MSSLEGSHPKLVAAVFHFRKVSLYLSTLSQVLDDDDDDSGDDDDDGGDDDGDDGGGDHDADDKG